MAFGKTIVAIRMMAERGLNTLILAHRCLLMDQWIERLAMFSDLPREAMGVIGGGRRKPKRQVDVALIQSLVRKDEVDDLVGGYGYAIVDRCHHVSAVSFVQCGAREATQPGDAGEDANVRNADPRLTPKRAPSDSNGVCGLKSGNRVGAILVRPAPSRPACT